MKKLRITVEGKTYDVEVQVLEDDEAVVSGAGFVSPLPTPAVGRLPAIRGPVAPPAAAPRVPASQPNAILAPIAGTVQKVFVAVGASVEAHAPVVLLDAMKMDTYIYAPREATVTEIAVQPGDSVQVGDCLIRYSARE
jgi:biotin carboxyl carrier protein